MILTSNRQTKSQKPNKQENVCNFYIKFLSRIWPPYNIQIDDSIPTYRKKYLSIWPLEPYEGSILNLYTLHIFIQIYSHSLGRLKSLGSHKFCIGIASIINFKTFWFFVINFTYCGFWRYRIPQNLETARGFYTANFLILIKYKLTINDIFANFLKKSVFQRGRPNRVPWSSYWGY